MAGGKGKGRKRPPAKRPASARPPAKATGTGGKPPPSAPPTPAPAPAASAPKAAPPKGKPTRTERLDAARRARKRKALLTRLGVVGAIATVAAIIAAVVISDRRAADAERERLTAGSSCTFDTESDDTTSTPHRPVPPRYEVDPPAGGNHDPAAVPAGVYGDQTGIPTDQKLVHSLEHGFVILWHRPDISEEEKAEIREVFENHSADVLVVPRPSLQQQKVVATSWGKRLLCGEVEGDRLSQFVELYRNESPEAGTR